MGELGLLLTSNLVQSINFVTGVKIKGTSDSEINDSSRGR